MSVKVKEYRKKTKDIDGYRMDQDGAGRLEKMSSGAQIKKSAHRRSALSSDEKEQKIRMGGTQ